MATVTQEMRDGQRPVNQARVKFTRNPEQVDLIRQCANRAVALYAKHGVNIDRTETEMDLSATNANGCRLDFKKLRDADDFNFMHDITGINRHLDRETGKLGGFFSPRCSRK